MAQKDIFDYLKTKKKSNVVSEQLKKLLTSENVKRVDAVFTDFYDNHKTINKSDTISMSFEASSNLDVVSDMLVECAKIRYEKRLEEIEKHGLIDDNPTSNVMLYDASTRKLIGGVIVYPNMGDPVACVINEGLRQENKRIISTKDAM